MPLSLVAAFTMFASLYAFRLPLGLLTDCQDTAPCLPGTVSLTIAHYISGTLPALHSRASVPILFNAFHHQSFNCKGKADSGLACIQGAPVHMPSHAIQVTCMANAQPMHTLDSINPAWTRLQVRVPCQHSTHIHTLPHVHFSPCSSISNLSLCCCSCSCSWHILLVACNLSSHSSHGGLLLHIVSMHTHTQQIGAAPAVTCIHSGDRGPAGGERSPSTGIRCVLQPRPQQMSARTSGTSSSSGGRDADYWLAGWLAAAAADGGN